MILKVKMKKSRYLIFKRSRGTRICRHQPLTASVETSRRKMKTKSLRKLVLLGSQVSSPSPDSAHLEGTSGNVGPCPLTADGSAGMARPDGKKDSEAEWLSPAGTSGHQHSAPGLQAAPQGLEGPLPGVEPWWALWTPRLPVLFRRPDGEGGNSRVCSFIELRGASSLL